MQIYVYISFKTRRRLFRCPLKVKHIEAQNLLWNLRMESNIYEYRTNVCVCDVYGSASVKYIYMSARSDKFDSDK